MTPTYDPNNIFAKILRGEAPCVKVCEDEVSLAFMDVMPRAEGHTLVVPKVPARNLSDIAPDDLARFMPSLWKVARAVDDYLAYERAALARTIAHYQGHAPFRRGGDNPETVGEAFDADL